MTDEDLVLGKEMFFGYLDGLRESGVTNMFGAVPYLRNRFDGMSQSQAIKVLTEWMETFDMRHPRVE